MSNEIKRATGYLVIEVVNSNPNGDPDRESDPRQRPNGCGEISPVSFKRKLRDLLEDHDTPFFHMLPEKFQENGDRYWILEHRGRDRNMIKSEMGKDPAQFLESQFVKKYWDARVFGNTFLEDGGDKGFIKTGVVQFGMGVSIAPVEILRQTNTNKAGVQEGKSAGMAPLAYRIVEHGVYCMPFFVNPNYAKKSGCTADDIELLKLLIPTCVCVTHGISSIRAFWAAAPIIRSLKRSRPSKRETRTTRLFRGTITRTRSACPRVCEGLWRTISI